MNDSVDSRTGSPLYGLTLSSEEHPPGKLVEIARAAEDAGFDFVSISDHFHPWIGEQGHSPFVWSVLGAISEATDHIEVGVGVTCPIMRIHPAVLAQAVATTACLLEGRFTWGVGSGEALNEHILGDRWPPAPVRIEMLAESIDVIRKLLSGDSITHYGKHFTVEDARIFDVPDQMPPIVVSAFGERAAELAAEVGDGLWTTGTGDLIDEFRANGGSGPVWSQLSLCWDRDRDTAVERAHRVWPNTTVPGQLSQDLRTVGHFEQAVEPVTREQIADQVLCGPDLGPLVESARTALDAGVSHLYFHQIGDPLDGFIDAWFDEVRPELP
ncbi:TIGR03557 family F420-dependent LLM class oxidoreductase [Ilumatobacter nonamiensis]|uniref:TIGR03557 family F420-dependent LLM class oxidoreductase n=1 Tax=Ilumatobacter nonamiensis TaxID=467093 RepID=UPI00034A3B77|nr:TIGR03557 family F420-dependent LLM class oxidoreductase [Ilumatobacter nonamiensis]